MYALPRSSLILMRCTLGYKNLDKMLKEIDGEGADGKFTTPEFVDWPRGCC